MSNDIRTGYELAAKAIAERGQAWSSRGDYALAMECSQLVSMLHDLKPVAAPVASAAPSVIHDSNFVNALGAYVGTVDLGSAIIDLEIPEHVTLVKIIDSAIAHQPPKEALTDEQIIEALTPHIDSYPSTKAGETSFWITQPELISFVRAIIAATAPNKQLVEAPNMDDWNVQMACVKALLNCTDGELECTGLKLLDSYIEDVKRVVAAALASAGVPLKGE